MFVAAFTSVSRRSPCVVGSLARCMSSIPSTMKAAVVREVGDANALKVEPDYPSPKLAADQVIVKNEYSGINFIDTYHRSGLYKRELPFIGGQEGGGKIVEVSAEAEKNGFKVGDRVVYSVLGSYAEYTAVPTNKLLSVPDDLAMDVATSCVVQGMTAHYLTTSAHADLIKPGEWCLIHGVAGGTCQWAAQMAKLRGFKVIGTAPKGKREIAEALGCDELILLDEKEDTDYEDYESMDVAAKVKEITGEMGVKAVIDGIGKSTMDISIEVLARRGIFVSFGNASGKVPPFEVIRLINKSAYVTRPKLLDYVVDREELTWRANEILGWLADGKLKVVVDKTFPLDEAAAGHLYLQAGKTKGKVLYEIK